MKTTLILFVLVSSFINPLFGQKKDSLFFGELGQCRDKNNKIENSLLGELNSFIYTHNIDGDDVQISKYDINGTRQKLKIFNFKKKYSKFELHKILLLKSGVVCVFQSDFNKSKKQKIIKTVLLNPLNLDISKEKDFVFKCATKKENKLKITVSEDKSKIALLCGVVSYKKKDNISVERVGSGLQLRVLSSVFNELNFIDIPYPKEITGDKILDYSLHKIEVSDKGNFYFSVRNIRNSHSKILAGIDLRNSDPKKVDKFLDKYGFNEGKYQILISEVKLSGEISMNVILLNDFSRYEYDFKVNSFGELFIGGIGRSLKSELNGCFFIAYDCNSKKVLVKNQTAIGSEDITIGNSNHVFCDLIYSEKAGYLLCFENLTIVDDPMTDKIKFGISEVNDNNFVMFNLQGDYMWDYHLDSYLWYFHSPEHSGVINSNFNFNEHSLDVYKTASLTDYDQNGILYKGNRVFTKASRAYWLTKTTVEKTSINNLTGKVSRSLYVSDIIPKKKHHTYRYELRPSSSVFMNDTFYMYVENSFENGIVIIK